MESMGWYTTEEIFGNYIGSFIVIAINGSLITVDVRGTQVLSHQHQSPPDVTKWYVVFGGVDTRVQWDFFDPCGIL